MQQQPPHIPFTKMQGAGNDFIIIDNRNQLLSEQEVISLTPTLCNRRFGIGADGLIALFPPQKDGLDYTMFYRNADGSDAGMCGNGARCLALYACLNGLDTQLTFNVHETIYQAEVDPEQHSATIHFPIQTDIKKVMMEDEAPLFQLHTGTEHIVRQASQKEWDNPKGLIREGRRLRHHPRFNPPGTNVNFIRRGGLHKIQIQTYERGVEDLTLACGTGAIASALVWHYLQPSPQTGSTAIQVEASGGMLQVQFTFDSTKQVYKNIQLSGPAQVVFEGRYTITGSSEYTN